jgi:hypothetical protein
MSTFLVAALVAAACLVEATRAAAQTVQGYGFGGATAIVGSGPGPMSDVGGGVDVMTRNGGGVSAEFGRIGTNRFGVAHLSIDGIYQTTGTNGKVSSFIVGGLSRFFDSYRGINTLNVGGGVKLWARPRVGVRFEVRDHIYAGAGFVQALSFRVGVAFR